MGTITTHRSLSAISYSLFAFHALAVALTLLGSAAFAATPEETYVVARDAFIAKFNPPGDPVAPSEATSKEEERARAELLKQMRSLIGPLNVRGFSSESAYNVGTLFKGDLETGILDGLVFIKDKDVRLVVTTTGLTDRWIKSPDGLAADEGTVPKDVRAALAQDAFYTRATSADAAVGNFGELPVTKPAGVDFVFAMLAARRQDFFPAPASEMLIGAIVPPRVYILSAPITNIKMMPPCEKLFKDAAIKAEKMYEAIEKSPNQQGTIVDDVDRLRERGDQAMRKCFAQRVKSDPAFAKLTKQAQDYVDALAGK
jgi:hypothetical protein